MQQKDPVLKVSGLVQKIGSRPVLKGLDLTLYPGECIGVFGLRATGKTTFLHALAGVNHVSGGSVEICGKNILKEDSFKKNIGLVTQVPSLFQDLKAGENLDFIASLKNTSLDTVRDLLPELELLDYLKSPVNNLEAGVYQRLALACAMLGSPQLLLADELINDVDLYSRKLILRVLSSFVIQGGACLWAFSNIEFSNYMSRIAWLEDGLITLFEPVQAYQKWQEKLESVMEEQW